MKDMNVHVHRMHPVQITCSKRPTRDKHDVEGGDDNNDIPTVNVNSHSTPIRKLLEYLYVS